MVPTNRPSGRTRRALTCRPTSGPALAPRVRVRVPVPLARPGGTRGYAVRVSRSTRFPIERELAGAPPPQRLGQLLDVIA